MNEPYTESEMERAINFIEERLALQRRCIYLIKNAMYNAALAILDLAKKFNIDPKHFKFSLNQSLDKKVDNIISNLIDSILSDIEDVATFGLSEDNEESRMMLSWVNISNNGNTIANRIKNYARQFKNEMEVVVAASAFLGKSPKDASNIIKTNLHYPLGSIFVKVAKKEKFSSVQSLEANLNVGKYTSTFNNIKRASLDTIARSRQKLFYHREKANGADSWYVKRSSSCPCTTCDMNVGIHKTNEDLPPYHPNCVCMAIPLNTNKK